MTEPIFTVALLVGGRGRRLGGVDKSTLIVDGRTILARQLQEARAVTPQVIAVASAAGSGTTSDIPTVIDHFPGAGPLGALITAILDSPTDVTVVVAGDMPYVTGPFLAWLAGQCGESNLVLPRDAGGYHPLCAAYHRTAAPALQQALDSGERRVQTAVRALRTLVVGPEDYAAFDPEGRLLLNVNTPEDYHSALDRHP